MSPCRAWNRGALVTACLLSASCGGSSPTTPTGVATEPSGLVFSESPLDPAMLQYIVPLGNMGPYAHTLPTDHIYFYHRLSGGGSAPVALVTPAAGTVSRVLPVNGEVKLWVRVNGTFTYYLDHLTLAPGIREGTRLDAGAPLGTSVGIAFDMGLVNYAMRIGFINPGRYGGGDGGGGDTVSTDAPLKYFQEPIRSLLYAKVRREGPDLDGRINYDVAGTLSGNWFAEDLSLALSNRGDMHSGTRQLAFARDAWFPDRPRVSIGGLGMTGLYGVPPEAADFSTVTPASEKMVYRLFNTGEPGGPPGTTQLGLLIVEMLDPQRIRVEAVPDSLARTAAFSANAQIYVR